jgi:hypothetical protein
VITAGQFVVVAAVIAMLVILASAVSWLLIKRFIRW